MKTTNNLPQIQECNCGLREEFEKIKEEKGRECQTALQECKKSAREKDRQMAELKKKHTVMLVLVVIVATILGKETVDEVASWIESVNSIKSGVEEFTSQAEHDEWEYDSRSAIAPAPGALALLAVAGVAGARRRRR
tara:strand:- start:844 stop:1254 length:411 start_codon:yes stop_codon:yes gene_type:complete